MNEGREAYGAVSLLLPEPITICAQKKETKSLSIIKLAPFFLYSFFMGHENEIIFMTGAL